ncbi:hypothetical protein NDK47_14560 [Brevibacillus ruminantium]|uniref:Uncharacterized protein n=1 Tax=Brevibacillus ruminantium TaxID=2950604 RepID=A0ABY4WFG6_9BACL|nr:hypothetical protein [Brevibacillus ruminantium]USG63401.1 hypothetical protein NDK47_14560 [Brevibacillus ruminantium]
MMIIIWASAYILRKGNSFKMIIILSLCKVNPISHVFSIFLLFCIDHTYLVLYNSLDNDYHYYKFAKELGLMSLIFPILTFVLIAIGAFCIFISMDNDRLIRQTFVRENENKAYPRERKGLPNPSA